MSSPACARADEVQVGSASANPQTLLLTVTARVPIVVRESVLLVRTSGSLAHAPRSHYDLSAPTPPMTFEEFEGYIE